MNTQFNIDRTRLCHRLDELAKIGAIEEGGVCRLTLTNEDKHGRDLLIAWMKELGMTVHIDGIGNIIGVRQGLEDIPAVMIGSHLDTVSTGGRLDGSYGVLAGLEVIQTLNDRDIQTQRPIAVAMFTNEEGVRYTPDMMGSLVYVGGLSLNEALASKGIDGSVLGEELARIRYAGDMPCGAITPHVFVELHVEQGPILGKEHVTIGAVENLMGISWQEITILGEANHAGTTPLELRHDAGLVAARVISFVRELATSIGGNQRGTCGVIEFFPNLINVIPEKAKFTVDLRNSDEELLQQAEQRLRVFIEEAATQEGVTIQSRQLVRCQPVQFHHAIVEIIEHTARELGYNSRRMTSGAGHDAQMMARICPTAMIFVPSQGGISHNPLEYTNPEELEAGANVLLHTVLKLANQKTT